MIISYWKAKELRGEGFRVRRCPFLQAKVPYSQGKQGQFWGTRLSTRIGDQEEEEELADDAVDLVIDALMKWTAAEGFFLHATQFC